MIDIDKWRTMTDDEKMLFCKSVKSGTNYECVSKQDWQEMFEYLLDKIGRRRVDE